MPGASRSFVAQAQAGRPASPCSFPRCQIAAENQRFIPGKHPPPPVRIRVYLYGENPNQTSPHRHVTKSTAVRWHGWGTHVWIGKASIQERYAEPFRVQPGRVIPPAERYSPERMPPLEVPQVHFREPSSAAWRLVHRMVIFPRA